MKRLALAMFFIAALPLAAAEKWVENYNRGVAAVNAKNYRVAADALQKAIAEMPTEGTSVRSRNSIMTYVPHFFLGIAKFNLGDVDGALREWRTSEEQGAIGKTEYYANMKDWVARAQTEKKRTAQTAASGAKKAAADAISRALATQVDALSAGGDRSENYRAAQRLLQDANAQYNKAGTDIAAFGAAEAAAKKATAMFLAAADDGKKLKAARTAPKPKREEPPPPAIVPVEAKPIEPPKPAPLVEQKPPEQKPPEQKPVEQKPIEQKPPEPKPAPVITEEEAQKKIAAQQAKQRPAAVPVAAASAVTVTKSLVPSPAAPDLNPAYRAFALGDLASAESLLTSALRERPSGEAYLLRGCARYTRAMLSRTPEPLLAEATADFRAALQQNRSLQLDRRAFSPKLIDFFEQVRNGR
ncbi:MAG TPA: hypothetical protein VHL59_05045 [Thermoanaerobaculia bacterium]|nr:hypothetical protein [Thermoanaerobaculia bacterium]